MTDEKDETTADGEAAEAGDVKVDTGGGDAAVKQEAPEPAPDEAAPDSGGE